MTYAGTPRSSASSRRDAFARDVEQLARRLRVSTLGLSAGDQHLLKDIADGRYPMITLQRLMTIAARSYKPEDRAFLPEIVRRECELGKSNVLDVAAAFDAECRAEGEANVAQRDFERSRCRASWDRAVEKLSVHLSTLRTSLDAVLVHRNWQ